MKKKSPTMTSLLLQTGGDGNGNESRRSKKEERKEIFLTKSEKTMSMHAVHTQFLSVHSNDTQVHVQFDLRVHNAPRVCTGVHFE